MPPRPNFGNNAYCKICKRYGEEWKNWNPSHSENADTTAAPMLCIFPNKSNNYRKWLTFQSPPRARTQHSTCITSLNLQPWREVLLAFPFRWRGNRGWETHYVQGAGAASQLSTHALKCAALFPSPSAPGAPGPYDPFDAATAALFLSPAGVVFPTWLGFHVRPVQSFPCFYFTLSHALGRPQPWSEPTPCPFRPNTCPVTMEKSNYNHVD